MLGGLLNDVVSPKCQQTKPGGKARCDSGEPHCVASLFGAARLRLADFKSCCCLLSFFGFLSVFLLPFDHLAQYILPYFLR